MSVYNINQFDDYDFPAPDYAYYDSITGANDIVTVPKSAVRRPSDAGNPRYVDPKTGQIVEGDALVGPTLEEVVIGNSKLTEGEEWIRQNPMNYNMYNSWRKIKNQIREGNYNVHDPITRNILTLTGIEGKGGTDDSPDSFLWYLRQSGNSANSTINLAKAGAAIPSVGALGNVIAPIFANPLAQHAVNTAFGVLGGAHVLSDEGVKKTANIFVNDPSLSNLSLLKSAAGDVFDVSMVPLGARSAVKLVDGIARKSSAPYDLYRTVSETRLPVRDVEQPGFTRSVNVLESDANTAEDVFDIYNRQRTMQETPEIEVSRNRLSTQTPETVTNTESTYLEPQVDIAESVYEDPRVYEERFLRDIDQELADYNEFERLQEQQARLQQQEAREHLDLWDTRSNQEWENLAQQNQIANDEYVTNRIDQDLGRFDDSLADHIDTVDWDPLTGDYTLRHDTYGTIRVPRNWGQRLQESYETRPNVLEDSSIYDADDFGFGLSSEARGIRNENTQNLVNNVREEVGQMDSHLENGTTSNNLSGTLDRNVEEDLVAAIQNLPFSRSTYRGIDRVSGTHVFEHPDSGIIEIPEERMQDMIRNTEERLRQSLGLPSEESRRVQSAFESPEMMYIDDPTLDPSIIDLSPENILTDADINEVVREAQPLTTSPSELVSEPEILTSTNTSNISDATVNNKQESKRFIDKLYNAAQGNISRTNYKVPQKTGNLAHYDFDISTIVDEKTGEAGHFQEHLEKLINTLTKEKGKLVTKPANKKAQSLARLEQQAREQALHYEETGDMEKAEKAVRRVEVLLDKQIAEERKYTTEFTNHYKRKFAKNSEKAVRDFIERYPEYEQFVLDGVVKEIANASIKRVRPVVKREEPINKEGMTEIQKALAELDDYRARTRHFDVSYPSRRDVVLGDNSMHYRVNLDDGTKDYYSASFFSPEDNPNALVNHVMSNLKTGDRQDLTNTGSLSRQSSQMVVQRMIKNLREALRTAGTEHETRPIRVEFPGHNQIFNGLEHPIYRGMDLNSTFDRYSALRRPFQEKLSNNLYDLLEEMVDLNNQYVTGDATKAAAEKYGMKVIQLPENYRKDIDFYPGFFGTQMRFGGRLYPSI